MIAALYAAVGLGGGTGYLAVMGLLGVAPATMKPAALALNILVAGVGVWKYSRAGQFSRRLFWPIALVSIPAAALGGWLSLPASYYRPIVGLVLIYTAIRLWRSTGDLESAQLTAILPIWLVILAGALIGLVSGLLGLGGGIFLGPLLLLTGWSDTRQAMGITAAFVFVNSIAGLVGNVSLMRELPPELGLWLFAAGIGGWVGAEFGSRHVNPRYLRRMLVMVLLAAALRLIFV